MNRNSESHFSNNPTIGISRSKFDRSFTHKTTFNTGDLIPIFCDCTIMPGDTVKMRMSEVVRMMTPITPVMDNANLDLYFFFVPYRLVWNHFKRFMGENDTAPWTQETEYKIPQIYFPTAANAGGTAGWHKGDLADYFGYPTELGGDNTTASQYHASSLPFKAYALVWNEFFRDENLQNPVYVGEDNDSALWGVSQKKANYNPVNSTICGGKPLKVCKYHDYFSSALPGAQKGPSVSIPLSSDHQPVLWGKTWNTEGTGHYVTKNETGKEAVFKPTYVSDEESAVAIPKYKTTDGNPYYQELSTNTHDMGTELYVDLSRATGATVNQLRQAFAVQKFYERQALGGSRYIEMVKAHFDVTNPDFRVQRPEYLGGKRIPININQVIQSTPTNGESTPLGATGAYSLTADSDEMFTKSFTEHGILLGLACIRTVHTYQQGLNRQYSKESIFDFYFPEFANLGNQAILSKEIYMDSNTTKNEEAWGYQEAWACERYFPDIVTASMRSNYRETLDIWHWADYYETRPELGDKWIQETDENIKRTLAIQDEDQFKADFYFGAIYTRPMPLYSIPGLIDHH